MDGRSVSPDATPLGIPGSSRPLASGWLPAAHLSDVPRFRVVRPGGSLDGLLEEGCVVVPGIDVEVVGVVAAASGATEATAREWHGREDDTHAHETRGWSAACLLEGGAVATDEKCVLQGERGPNVIISTIKA